MTIKKNRVLSLLLLASVVGGAGLAIFEAVVTGSGTGFSDQRVADVNGKPIRLVEYTRTLDAVATDKRDAITDVDRVFVLKRLIEEELLVQEGLNSNLITTNRRLRSVVVNVMLETILANTASSGLKDEVVLAYYQSQIASRKGDIPPFENIRSEIEEHLQSLNQDAEIEAYIKWLRQQASVETIIETKS